MDKFKPLTKQDQDPNGLVYAYKVENPPDSISDEKILHPDVLINQYKELDDILHDQEKLLVLDEQYDSLVYKHDNLVLKFEIDEYIKDNNYAFYREIIIGLELNKLHNENFVKTIGYYRDEKCRLSSYLKNKQCVYLYLEFLPSITLKEYNKSATLSDFKSVMMKLLKSYIIAYERFEFCHYDLHHKNILILKDTNHPVFIDFEAAHIKLKDGHIGENWPEVGRYPNHAVWVYDFFKIFAFCWRDTYVKLLEKRIIDKYNKKIYKSTEGMAEYFSDVYSIHMGFDIIEDENGESNDFKWDETYEELLERAKPELTEKSYNYYKNLSSNAMQEKALKLSHLNQNMDNYLAINNYCVQVLQFFGNNKDEKWLYSYHSQRVF